MKTKNINKSKITCSFDYSDKEENCTEKVKKSLTYNTRILFKSVHWAISPQKKYAQNIIPNTVLRILLTANSCNQKSLFTYKYT